MSLRKAIWLTPAFADLEGVRHPVAYKHHLDVIETNPGEKIIFYRYRARARQADQDGLAWEWGEDFKLAVQRTGKIIVAEPEWSGGKLIDVGDLNCVGGSLSIEIRPSPVERLKIGGDSSLARQDWSPEGYDNPDHIWNHADLRG